MGKCNEKGKALESALELKIDKRKHALLGWLKETCGIHPQSFEALAGDASFRRYFRVRTENASFIAVDASPLYENCQAFIAIANQLRKMRLMTPEIFFADIEQGFLLITDFGDTTYLKALRKENADELYDTALTALINLSQCHSIPGRAIPPFTREFMWQEWAWHKEWFIGKWLQLELKDEKALDECFAYLVESAARQPQVFMHRDFHSANLMVLPEKKVGILDFQDAFIGPITYDVVSLLRDCYIDWPLEKARKWAAMYLEKLKECNPDCRYDQAEFLQWFDLMGVERHLKALFTFSRKHVRDNQSHYLQAVSRTLRYIEEVSATYPLLKNLHDYYRSDVRSAFEDKMQ